jgi:hypothetical protein
MDTNYPLSTQYDEISKEWIDADSAANLLEDTKSAFLAQLMLSKGDMPVSKAEMHSKASLEWTEYVKNANEQRKKANILKAQLEVIRMRFYEWQSKEATKRAEMRL